MFRSRRTANEQAVGATNMKTIIKIYLFLTISNIVFGQGGNWNGLHFEIPNSSNENENFFNIDNKVYIPGKTFIFSYLFIKNADTSLCRVESILDQDRKKWTLLDVKLKDSLAIVHIGFKIQKGYGDLRHLFPEYSQTVIQQVYYSEDKILLSEGLTGLVENDSNVWIHPFRDKCFSITELSPFLFVKFPLVIGKKWTWRLEDIEEKWSDARFIEYHGKVTATYIYEITNRQKLNTPFGSLDCYVIKAEARNRLGRSYLTSYFNEKYGFVKLIYQNIDGSEIEQTLIEVRN